MISARATPIPRATRRASVIGVIGVRAVPEHIVQKHSDGPSTDERISRMQELETLIDNG
jgi:hypothetical protein